MRKIVIFLLALPSIFLGQTTNWTKELKIQKAFIENKGQFTTRTTAGFNSQVEFAFDGYNEEYYFTKSGVVIELSKKTKHLKSDEEKKWRNERKRQGFTTEEWLEFEAVGHKLDIKKDELIGQWVGANPNVQIISENKNLFTHSYSYYDKDGELKHVSNASSFTKLTYKNIYPNIDVVYELNPDGGLKYSITVRPGGNISAIRLKYSKDAVLNNDGTIKTNTIFGNITDHKPVTFYEDNQVEVIHSSYNLSNNIIGFNVGNYNTNRTIVIDPWTQTPALTIPSGVWEVEADAAGNVYVIGGGTPMQLIKYNSTGVFQWIYNTPYDTNNGDWLGALATDNAGNSYVTRGSSAAITKVNTTGGVVYSANGGGFDEYWQISFNCDQTKLLVGGTRLPFFPTGSFESAMIFDVDPANGSVLGSVFVGWSQQAGLINNPDEVRSITSSFNAKYYFLTLDSIGSIDQMLGSSCPNPLATGVNSTYNFSYKCEDFRPDNGNGPMSAIVADANFLYTQNGSVVHKRDLNTYGILTTAAIPGGITTGPAPFTGGYQAGNSGIAMDDCGNVYVGSSDRIIKYDGNLNLITSTAVPYRVSDVEVSSSGEIVLCGSTGTSASASRTGYVQSVNMSACAPTTLVCCDVNVCPIEPLCVTDAPITLTPNTPGGTWSSIPATAGLNTSTGVFSPSVAGVGSFVITYTLACGTSSTTINVGTCTALDICYNGLDLVVSNGTGTYTWSTCSSVNSGSCVSWTAVETGTNYTTSSTTDIILVEDGVGVTDTLFTGITGVPACSATCDATITAAGPFCVNAAAVNLTAAETGGTWSGTGITNTSTGTFNPATAGAGNHTITYTLSCGDVDTETIIVNASDDASFTYPSGSYCLSDPNPTPSITGTAGGTFTINNSGVINASTGVVNLSGSGLGSYIVTYTTTGTCPDTNTFNITITNTTDATITQAGPFCQNATALNLTAVSPGGTWTGTGITDGTLGTFNPTTAGVGNHVITYTITGSCGDVDTMTIVVNATDNPAFSYSSNSFCLTDVNPTPTITGLAGGTFTINNGGVINASTGVINITSSGAGSFIVTYTTNGSCPNSQTFNLTINSCTSPLPVANFAASQTNICIGDCISFTDMSSSSAGGITSWVWTFTGATPASSSSQNPANICYNTAGTYQVVLTVTDANGSDTETKTGYITVTSCTAPTASFSISDTAICAGSCINFTDASIGATSWQWTFENGNPPSSTVQNPTNICFNDSGTHEVKLVVSNTFGSDSVIQYVTVYQPQQVFVGNDTIIQLGESVGLNATSVTNGVYTWSPPTDLSCTVCPSPISTPEETITYTVITSDTNGCVTSDNITIIVEFENVIFVPNIFSPNGDGVNDMLFVRGKGVAELKFFVYDRWGEKVFETTRLDIGWDGTFRGKDMNKAVFVYYLEATFIDGKQVTQKGDITLIK